MDMQQMSIVDEYLKSIDNENIKENLLTSLQYPQTKNLQDKPIHEFYYNCKENGCDFRKAKLQINENPDLLDYGVLKIAQTLVNQIEENPEEFIPHKLDGFQLNRDNIAVLRLRREGDDNNRIGLIEYNTIRARTMQLSSHVRNEAMRKIASKIVDIFIPK